MEAAIAAAVIPYSGINNKFSIKSIIAEIVGIFANKSTPDADKQ